MSNQDALSEDLESDPLLNSALQRFTSKLYYRFGSFLAIYQCWTDYEQAILVGTKCYRCLKMVEQMDLRKGTSEYMTTPSRYEGLGAAITAEVMIGF